MMIILRAALEVAKKFLLNVELYFFAEGLAVGVGFGAIGKTAAATFENARYIKILIKLYYSKCKSIRGSS